MQKIPIRDMDGFLRSVEAGHKQMKPLVYCPEYDGLRVLERCEACEFHDDTFYEHVACQSTKPYRPPEYYDRKRGCVTRIKTQNNGSDK